MMKIKQTINLTLVAYIFMSFLGCSKFLDVPPSSTSINPTRVRDFQEMLNNDSLSNVRYFLLDMMSDDVQLTDAQYNVGDNLYRRTYLWESAIWNPDQEDFIYNGSYSRILQMNVILQRINNAPAGDDNTIVTRSNVISQALINRAWYYLQLVNAYGNAYDAKNAASDLAVPLILTPDADVLKPRSSVEEVYNAIISDLTKAVNNPHLPSKGSDIIHPGKASGYALLARAYLYKQDYDLAQRYADSTLNLESSLINLNARAYNPSRLLDLSTNPEILLGRLTTEANFFVAYNGNVTIGRPLRDSLSITDRRYVDRFSNDIYRLNTVNSRVMTFDNSVGVAEVMLIKAECLARAGNVNGASAILTTLRANRIPQNALGNRNYNQGNILNYVLGERRRELFYKGGLRLFDLKRLNKEDLLRRNITRISGNGASTTNSIIRAVLPAGSGKYLMPFSFIVTAANPSIVQNPRL